MNCCCLLLLIVMFFSFSPQIVSKLYPISTQWVTNVCIGLHAAVYVTPANQSIHSKTTTTTNSKFNVKAMCTWWARWSGKVPSHQHIHVCSLLVCVCVCSTFCIVPSSVSVNFSLVVIVWLVLEVIICRREQHAILHIWNSIWMLNVCLECGFPVRGTEIIFHCRVIASLHLEFCVCIKRNEQSESESFAHIWSLCASALCWSRAARVCLSVNEFFFSIRTKSFVRLWRAMFVVWIVFFLALPSFNLIEPNVLLNATQSICLDFFSSSLPFACCGYVETVSNTNWYPQSLELDTYCFVIRGFLSISPLLFPLSLLLLVTFPTLCPLSFSWLANGNSLII